MLILHPSYPRALTHQKLFLAGGVVAAFECKLTLRTNHLREFFARSVALKRQLRPRLGTLFDELHHRPIVGLLAHSYAWNRQDGHELLKRIQRVESKYCETPRDLPDIVAIADTATVVLGSTSVLGPKVRDAEIDSDIIDEILSDRADGAIAMTYYSQEDRGLLRNDTGLALAELLRSLVERTAMQDPSLQPFAEYLTNVGSRGGLGVPTFWNPQLLSEGVRQRLRAQAQGRAGGRDLERAVALVRAALAKPP